MQALAPGVFRFYPIGMMSDQYRRPRARRAAHLNAAQHLLCLESCNRGSVAKCCDYLTNLEFAE
jgi:hypothetical protein